VPDSLITAAAWNFVNSKRDDSRCSVRNENNAADTIQTDKEIGAFLSVQTDKNVN